MNDDEGTEVYCELCNRNWVTRAKKKAVCTNKDCKSTKIRRRDNDEKFNQTTDFIKSQSKTAEKMTTPLKEFVAEQSASPIEEFEQSEKKVLQQLFEKDGRTPKTEFEEVGSLLANLPKPSPYLVSSVQNLSLIPARIFGAQWIMAPEEAELIAASMIPVLKEIGINVNKLDPKISLAIALGMYALPRLIVMFFSKKGGEIEPPEQSETSETVIPSPSRDFGTPPPTNKPITHAEKTEAQFEEFKELYSSSLDEQGKDLYASQRGIKKPKATV